MNGLSPLTWEFYSYGVIVNKDVYRLAVLGGIHVSESATALQAAIEDWAGTPCLQRVILG